MDPSSRSPPKPFERNRRAPTLSPHIKNQSTPSVPLPTSSQTSNSSDTPPPITRPTSPTAYNNSLLQRQNYGYGGYPSTGSYLNNRYTGRYGGYGGYGGGYGGYGSYGNYGGYGGYSYGYRPGEPPMGQGGILESPWLRDLQSFADRFARFSQLIELNCDAVLGSVTSFLRLMDSVGALRRETLEYLGNFFSTIMAPILLIGGLLPFFPSKERDTPGKLDFAEFSQFNGDKLSRNTPNRTSAWRGLFVLFVIFVAFPLLIRLVYKMGEKRGSMREKRIDEVERTPAEVLYDFEPKLSHEILVKKGDHVYVVDSPYEGWFEVETTDGKRGAVPSNYLKPLISNKTE